MFFPCNSILTILFPHIFSSLPLSDNDVKKNVIIQQKSLIAWVIISFVPAAGAEEVILSAAFQEPSGQTGTIEVTVTLADPAAPPAPPAITTPHTQAVPEPSTLALLGLGVLGLGFLRKRWTKRRASAFSD
jgi:hypothetical protein